MGDGIVREILEVSKLMYEKGMVNAIEGNVSVRDGDRVYVTPSGVCKGYLEPGMICVTDMEGNLLEGDLKPSSELRLHLAAYAMRGDARSVIHNHSPYATAYAIAGIPIESRAYPEMIVHYDRIEIVPYGTPSTDGIHEGMAGALGRGDVFLLANHGVVSVGKGAFDAFFKIETAESIAKILYLVRTLGGESPLSRPQLDELYAMRRRMYGR
ncbi:MAG: class II aldolase/adducin family protein [Oscillospiraceae bacterium]|nr:class II aldolase/adducin family protein [Oscillospiraceae bacterium]